MVKLISKKEQQIINEATEKAEAKANAHIVTILVPASDSYTHYIMLCGLIVATLLDLFLWQQKIITLFPNLLCIQLLIASLFPLIPGIRGLALKCLPKKIYHQRAAEVAAEKRLSVCKGVSASTPVLLIFISYAEHYIHIFPNAIIRDKIPDEKWQPIVRKLIRTIPKTSLAIACAEAIEESGELLYTHNPL